MYTGRDIIVSDTIARNRMWEPDMTKLVTGLLKGQCKKPGEGAHGFGFVRRSIVSVAHYSFPAGSIVVDVGAFIGWYTMLAGVFQASLQRVFASLTHCALSRQLLQLPMAVTWWPLSHKSELDSC